VTAESRDLTRHFFDATRALACDTGSLQERLADAYADHLLQVVANELPTELQTVFREVEEQMTADVDDDGGDPFRAAAERLSASWPSSAVSPGATPPDGAVQSVARARRLA
jgi:hypothetical protein